MNTTAKPKHTPGPWTWNGHGLVPVNPDPDQHAVHTLLDVDTFAYGFVCSEIHDVIAEDKANRALIAAAPDLLAALLIAEEFISGFEDDEAQEGMAAKLGTIRAAIAKAEGRP